MPPIHWDTIATGLVSTFILFICGRLWTAFKAYGTESKEWRADMKEHMDEQSECMGQMTKALQSTMRATLIHNAEKYFSRGSITPEERASWYDMHDKYSTMGFNGLIDTYRRKIDLLPDVTIEELMTSGHGC